MSKRAEKYLRTALGGNMNITTLKPLALIEIMVGFAETERKEAINSMSSCTELNNCFELYEHVIYQGIDMMITYVDDDQDTANLFCGCDKTNWFNVSLNKLTKII